MSHVFKKKFIDFREREGEGSREIEMGGEKERETD